MSGSISNKDRVDSDKIQKLQDDLSLRSDLSLSNYNLIDSDTSDQESVSHGTAGIYTYQKYHDHGH